MHFPVLRFLQRWKSAIQLKRLFIISKKSMNITIITTTMKTAAVVITMTTTTTMTMKSMNTNTIMTMSIITMTMTTTAAAATTMKDITMQTMFSRAWASKHRRNSQKKRLKRLWKPSKIRTKGIVEAEDGQWIHFDYVPGEPDVRTGASGVTGRLCVIGSEIDRDKILKLFEI